MIQPEVEKGHAKSERQKNVDDGGEMATTISGFAAEQQRAINRERSFAELDRKDNDTLCRFQQTIPAEGNFSLLKSKGPIGHLHRSKIHNIKYINTQIHQEERLTPFNVHPPQKKKRKHNIVSRIKLC